MNMLRHTSLPAGGLMLVLVALCLCPTISPAQDVRCVATRSGNALFVGRCTQDDSLVGDIQLRPPGPSATHLWLGTIRGGRFRSAASGGAVGETEIGVDTRPGGALRVGRSWLALRDARADGAELQFVFRFDRSEPASDVDVKILEAARAMLADPSRWNPADTTDMDAAPVKGFSCAPSSRQSMFCSLYLASLTVAGDYAHFRPAVNAVRQSVNAASKRQYRHPLIGFNNDTSVTLVDVQGVLDSALAIARAQRMVRDGCSRQCLSSLADQYLRALVAHDASGLPLAPRARFTENGVESLPGEGLWKNAAAPSAYRVSVVDPEASTVAVQTVMKDGDEDVQLLLRLKAVDGRISEAETLVARKGDTCCWAPERLETLSPVFGQALPAADRVSRDTMISIADGYFTALHTSGTPDYRRARLTRATNRYENGMQTTNVPGGGRLLGADAAAQFDSAMFGPIRVVNRRYLAVDPENGTALGIVVFESPNPARKPTIIAEFFKLSRGEIQEIRAVMVTSPSSGWR